MFTASATPQPLYNGMDQRKKERKHQIQFEEENPSKIAEQLVIPDDLGSSPIHDMPEDEAESATTYAPEKFGHLFQSKQFVEYFPSR